LSDKEFDKKMREENKLKQKKETENNIRQVKDKSNKDHWINCYKCATWCCPYWLPEAFKGKVTEVYTCSSCVNVNES